jgi:hypothetical protein
MQRCPKCYRTYQNDNQKYCTACGGRLVPDAEIPTSYGLEEAANTYVSSSPRIESAPMSGFDPNQTFQNQTPPAAFDPNKTVTQPPPDDSAATVMVSREALQEAAVETEIPDDAVVVAPTVALTPPATMPETLRDLEPAPEIIEPELVAPAPEIPLPEEVAPVEMPAVAADLPPAPEPPLPEPSFPVIAVNSTPLPPELVDEPSVAPENQEFSPPVIVPLPPPPAPKVITTPEIDPASAPPLPSEVAVKTAPSGAAAKPAKSRLPLILGLLLGLGVLGAAGFGSAYWFLIKPAARQTPPEPTPEATPSIAEATSITENTPPPPTPDDNGKANNNPTPTKPDLTAITDAPPPNTLNFVNDKSKLRGKLADNFVGFSLYYPKNWKAAKSAEVFTQFRLSGADGLPQEDFSIGYYDSAGTFAGDEAKFADLASKKSAEIAKSLPDYKKLDEGPTKINGLDGYQFSYEAQSKDAANRPLTLWGRVIFVPPGAEGQKNGVMMFLTATSKSPEVKAAGDVGEKGEMPIILNTFRFAKP